MKIVPTDRQTVKVGQRFGKLTVIGEPFYSRSLHKAQWPLQFAVCQCDCGNVKVIRATYLTSGHSQSCRNCGPTPRPRKQPRAQRQSKTLLYKLWKNMRNRCFNKNNQSYPDYGGRGITVCEEWRTSFIPFMEWAQANGYGPNVEIDRKENNGNYEPSNCRFVPRIVNINNTRTNRRIEIFGELKTFGEWARDERCKVNYFQFRKRVLKLGWEPERALVSPPRSSSRSAPA